MDELNTTVVGSSDGYDYGDQLYLSPDRPAYSDFKKVGFDPLPHHKPARGFWTSTWLGKPRLSRWVQFSASEGFYKGDERGWLITPKEGTVFVVVDSAEDLRNLVDMYPLEDTEPGQGNRVDFVSVAHDYDGVWLTAEGYSDTQTMMGKYDGLRSWGCESTIWFDWRVAGVEPIGEVRWEEHPLYREF